MFRLNLKQNKIWASRVLYTDKKRNFLIYKEIQSGAVAQSYMRKGLLIYEEMRKYFPIYCMSTPLVIYDFATAPFWISLYMRKIWFSFLSVNPCRPSQALAVPAEPCMPDPGRAPYFQWRPIHSRYRHLQTRSVCKHGRPRQAKQCKGSQYKLDIQKEAKTG